MIKRLYHRFLAIRALKKAIEKGHLITIDVDGRLPNTENRIKVCFALHGLDYEKVMHKCHYDARGVHGFTQWPITTLLIYYPYGDIKMKEGVPLAQLLPALCEFMGIDRQWLPLLSIGSLEVLKARWGNTEDALKFFTKNT